MAVVPTVSPDGVQNRPIAPGYQSSNAPIDAFGGTSAGVIQAGKELQATAGQVADIALKKQTEDNEREAKDLDVQFSSALRGIGYGDGTAQNQGYYATRGQDTISQVGDVTSAVDKARAQLLAQASNPRVAQLFGQSAAVRSEQEKNGISRHLEVQRGVAADATDTARQGEALSDAAARYTDPSVLAQSLHIAATSAASISARNGEGPDAAKARADTAQSVILQGVVKSALAAEDTATAQKAFETFDAANPGVLTGPVRVELLNSLRAGSLAEIGQKLSDTAQAKFPNDPAAQIKYVEENAKGLTRDKGLQELDAARQRTTSIKTTAWTEEEHKAIIEEHARAAINFQASQRDKAAAAAEDEYVSKGITPGGAVDLGAVAADARLSAFPERKLRLEALATQLAKGDPPAKVDRETYAALFARMNLPDDDPNKIIDETDINKAAAAGKLGRENLAALRKELADARTPEGSRLMQMKSDFLTGQKGQIMGTNSLGMADDRGGANYFLFKQYVDDQVAAARKKGEDPRKLFTFGAKEFLGTPETLNSFRYSAQDTMQHMMERIRGVTGSRVATEAAPATYSTIEDVQKAYNNGKGVITREQAEAALAKLGVSK